MPLNHTMTRMSRAGWTEIPRGSRGKRSDWPECYGLHRFKWNLKFRWHISPQLLPKVINDVFKHMAEHLWERGTLTLPGNFGRLYIQGFKKQPLMTKDRKMIYEQYVDWGSSLKMWQTDEEARQEGLLVRYNPGITYKIGFNLRTDRSNRTLVPNLSFFKFHSQTSLRKLGAEIIRAGEPPPIERSSMFRNKRGSVLAPRNYKEVKEMDKRRNNPWADFVY